MLVALRSTCSRTLAPIRIASNGVRFFLSTKRLPSFGFLPVPSNVQNTSAQRLQHNILFSRPMSSSLPEHTVLLMPALSPTMTQGNIASWLKKVGDKISPGDAIAELETDKATLGFEAVESGYLAAVMVPVGSKDVQVGTPLCIVVDSAGDIAAFSNYKQAPQSKAAAVAPPKASLPQSSAKPSATAPAASTASATAAPSHHSIPADLLAGPAVLRLLHENPHVNPLLVKGSGPKGRLLKGDVLAAIAGGALASHLHANRQSPLPPPTEAAPVPTRANNPSSSAKLPLAAPSAPAAVAAVKVRSNAQSSCCHMARDSSSQSQQPVGYTRSGAHRSFVQACLPLDRVWTAHLTLRDLQVSVDMRWAQCNCQVACASCRAKIAQ